MERQEREVRAAAAPSEASERGYVDWGSILAGAAIAAGLSAVLTFVGAKMLLADVYKVPIGLSLGIIALVIASSIALSLLLAPREEAPPPPAAAGGSEPASGPASAPAVAIGTDGRPPAGGA